MIELVHDLALATLIAWLLGVGAHLLRQPLLLAYLVARTPPPRDHSYRHRICSFMVPFNFPTVEWSGSRDEAFC
jgi:hypothetical protein